MSNNIPTFGILTDTSLYYIDKGSRQWVTLPAHIHTYAHVGSVMQLALENGLERIWVHLTREGYESLSDSFIADATREDYKFLTPTSFETTSYFYGWNERESGWKHNIGIGFLNHEYSRWCIDAENTPREAYAALYYLEKGLTIPMQFTPSNIGQRLIRDTNTSTKRAAYLTPCKRDLSLFRTHTGNAGVHGRRLTSAERSKPYLVHIDRNASFLNSCSIQLGYGDYEHISNPQFNVQIPGLWHITLEGKSEYEGVSLPAITPNLKEGMYTSWCYSPTVKLLIDAGYSVSIDEAYIWPIQRANILDPFKKLVSTMYSDLRENEAMYPLSVPRAIAKDALKFVYVSGLSNLSHDEVYAGSNAIDAPHWYHEVIADSYQRIIRNIMSIREATHLTPVITVVDGLYYAVDSLEKDALLSSVRLGSHVGVFKHVYTLPLSECLEVLDSELHPSHMIGELKKVRLHHA